MNLFSVRKFSPHFIYRKPDLLQMLMNLFFFLLNSIIIHILHIFWFLVNLIECFMKTFVKVDESFEI